MSVGDVARFTSVVNTEGRWESEPSGVLEVDHDQGVVVARRMGHARLRLRSGDSVFLRQIQVTPVSNIVSVESSVLGGDRDTVTVRLVLGGGESNLASESPVTSVVVSSASLFSCDLGWEREESVESVLRAEPGWSGSHWTCVITQVSPGPADPSTVSLSVLDTVHSLRYLPPVSVVERSVEVGVEGGKIRVSGHSEVLDMLVTRHSEGVELGSAWLDSDGDLVIPVSLTQTHYVSAPSVTVSVPATDQTLTINILPLVTTCRSNTGFLSAVLGELITYYQTVLCIITVAILTFYFTKSQIITKPASAPKTVPAPASPSAPASKTSESGQASSASSPYLWTVDNSPVYGSPVYR